VVPESLYIRCGFSVGNPKKRENLPAPGPKRSLFLLFGGLTGSEETLHFGQSRARSDNRRFLRAGRAPASWFGAPCRAGAQSDNMMAPWES